MFRGTPVTTTIEGANELESKYKVAEILSSMQSSSGLTPSVLSAAQFITTTATPIFTPITSVSVEQQFSQANSQAANMTIRESGFVPPVVEPNSQMPVMVQVKSEAMGDYDDDYSSIGSESDYGAPSAKRARMDGKGGKINIPDIDPSTYLVANSRRPTGPRKLKRDEKLTPDEEEKRNQRRERNKLAAAKCRKRREDVTNTLIAETENLEEEKNELENEILKLQHQKEQFEYLLESHKITCQHKHSLEHAHAPPKTTATMTFYPQPAHQHQSFVSKPSTCGGNVTRARPNSLQFATSGPTVPTTSLAAVTEALGIPISTPSTGMFGFDAMADGHTGLTPLTQFASSSMSTPVTSLATSVASCAGQVQNAVKRQSTDSSSSNGELASPTTLMAL